MTAAGVAVSTWEGARAEDWRVRWRIPRLDIYARIGSTNDAARQLAENGAPAGTVVLAEQQTAGRGRMGRTWTAPPAHALLLSVILRPGGGSGGEGKPGTAPVRVALAVARALERAEDVSAAVKWPNDIVVPGAGKLAGILCEAALAQPGNGYVVAGIGINTGQTTAEFPPELRGNATSVLLVTGRPADRAALAGALLAELRPFDLRDLVPLDSEERAEFDARDILRGCSVQVDGTAAGTGAGIAPDAALLITTPDGTLPVHHGTVRLRDAVGGQRYPARRLGGQRHDPSSENPA